MGVIYCSSNSNKVVNTNSELLANYAKAVPEFCGVSEFSARSWIAEQCSSSSNNSSKENNNNQKTTVTEEEKEKDSLVPVPYSTFCIDRKTENTFEWCENVDIKNNIAWCDFDIYDCIGEDYIQASQYENGTLYYPLTTTTITLPIDNTNSDEQDQNSNSSIILPPSLSNNTEAENNDDYDNTTTTVIRGLKTCAAIGGCDAICSPGEIGNGCPTDFDTTATEGNDDNTNNSSGSVGSGGGGGGGNDNNNNDNNSSSTVICDDSSDGHFCEGWAINPDTGKRYDECESFIDPTKTPHNKGKCLSSSRTDDLLSPPLLPPSAPSSDTTDDDAAAEEENKNSDDSTSSGITTPKEPEPTTQPAPEIGGEERRQ
jgi:hypothetical protein